MQENSLLDFKYSFGYDCKRLFNLCLIHEDVLVFGSGSFLHFYNTKTGTITFRRSYGGEGIGFILKNPNPEYNYLTVGESGTNPKVMIYKYPEMDVISILEGGAKRSYSCMDYSPDGSLLVTQAGEPDYMITIWKWKTSSIILRCLSFQNDILNVKFSPYDPRRLTTCGLGHIKFWKMSQTFTGLKLEGELGRFGKTDISDVYGICPLADETVISGCEWGNMLLWEAGLILIEITRKNRAPCHKAPIVQILFEDGEVTTIGMDGYVRVWFWGTVEAADPPDDDRFVEIEPIYEWRIGNKAHICEIRGFVAENPKDLENYVRYIQDGKGGIWKCILDPDKDTTESEQIYKCHGGKVVAIDISPFSPHIATLGEDGMLNLYNYESLKFLYQKHFPAQGTNLKWLPTLIDPSGHGLIMGFEDGVIRSGQIELREINGTIDKFHFFQAIKPHSKGILSLSYNTAGTILGTTSKDDTVFIFQIEHSTVFINLIPIGFIRLPSAGCALKWNPLHNSTLVLGCKKGEILQGDVPESPKSYTDISFLLKETNLKKLDINFMRDVVVEPVKKGEQHIEETTDKINEEEVEGEEEEPQKDLKPSYVSQGPPHILWIEFIDNNKIWFTMSSTEAGIIYEYRFGGSPDDFTKIPVPGADLKEIYSYLNHNNYHIFGTKDGAIRITEKDKSDTNLISVNVIIMHDVYNGIIPMICASFDEKFLFSIGYDGNLFVYKWLGPSKSVKIAKPISYTSHLPETDIESHTFPLSLEEQKIKDEQDRQLEILRQKRNEILDILSEYKFQFRELLKQNASLPHSQHFTQDDLELDKRITEDLQNDLREKMKLLKSKMAFHVEKASLATQKLMDYFIKPLENLSVEISGIRNGLVVTSFRLMRLDEIFYESRKQIEEAIYKKLQKAKTIQLVETSKEEDIAAQIGDQESFLQELSASLMNVKISIKLARFLKKYHDAKKRQKARELEREEMYSSKPDPSKDHPDDIRKIEEAKKTIGDYKLKTSEEYEPDENDNCLQKYKDILDAKEELFNMKSNFNKTVFELRKLKEELYNYIDERLERLKIIQKQIPKDQQQFINDLPRINRMKEFPEEWLKAKEDFNFSEDSHQTTEEIVPQDSTDSSLELNKMAFREDNFDPDSMPELQEILIAVEKYAKFFEEHKNKIYRSPNEGPTPWELESRHIKMMENLSEQFEILTDVNEKITYFDNQIRNILKEKLKTQNNTKFLENHMVTLDQELWVLRDFEGVEMSIQEKIDDFENDCNAIYKRCIERRALIEAQNKIIEALIIDQKEIQNEFANEIKGDKFAPFLAKIFKKKPKRVRETTGDDSDLSDSSESSSEEEEEPIDEGSSESIGIPLGIDENFRPPGCDVKLFNLTFEMRSKRHEVEAKISLAQKEISDLKKASDDELAITKKIQRNIATKKQELLVTRRKKQKELNKVQALVVLNVEQMRYITNDTDVSHIEKAILFKENIIHKLHNRVNELVAETHAVRQNHQADVIRLSRLKAECIYMQKQIKRLHEDVKDAMLAKFGILVDLNELKDSILKRYCNEVKDKLKVKDNKGAKIVAHKKKSIVRLKNELLKETRTGTEKLNILTALQEEKNFLTQIISYQEKLAVKTTKLRPFEVQHDLNKLKDISKEQENQIQVLENEIRALCLKVPIIPKIEEKPQSKDPCKIIRKKDTDSNSSKLDESSSDTLLKQVSFVCMKEKLDNLAKKFLTKYFKEQFKVDRIDKLISSISNFLAEFIENVKDSKIDDTHVSKAFEKLKILMPSKCFCSLHPDIVRKLLEAAIVTFTKCKSNINAKDVVFGVVSSVAERAQVENSLKDTQEFILEISKLLIETLPISDILKRNVIEGIISSINEVHDINPSKINRNKLFDDAMTYAKESESNPEIIEMITKFMEKFISELLHKDQSK